MLKIEVLSNQPPVQFAAKELLKYLQKMNPSASGNMKLGLYEDFSMPTPEGMDPRWDDGFTLDIDNLQGTIAGSNGRSVLYGVYTLLEKLGCAFLRMGEGGEVIPQRKDFCVTVKETEKASYRYRGQCIEGAVSYENMLQSVDWSAKAKMNCYMLEFMIPYAFFDRWYNEDHYYQSGRQKAPRSPEEVRAYCHVIEDEIKKRGMLYNAVGHGFMCAPFGYEALGWYVEKNPPPQEILPLLAEIKGKRGFHRDRPMATNLCFSNPKARQVVIDYVLDYLDEHKNIDILQFWLSDGSNNHCECADCRTKSPTDWYVDMLNELDEALTNAGRDNRIVFLLYHEMLWAPLVEKIKHQERFVLLFAPISRTYSASYNLDTKGYEAKPMVHNAIALPRTIEENILYLREWQKTFKGDGMAYEYYFMWDHFIDPGYYAMTKVMSEDLKKLKDLGLNGILSDQCQRAFFPTGFPMKVMAQTLWNDQTKTEEVSQNYFEKAFGKEGKAVAEYLQQVSELFDPVYLRGEKKKDLQATRDYAQVIFGANEGIVDEAAARKLALIPQLADSFMPKIQNGIQTETDKAKKLSWEALAVHGELIKLLSGALDLAAQDKNEEACDAWEVTKAYLWKIDNKFQPLFDMAEFKKRYDSRFKRKQ